MSVKWQDNANREKEGKKPGKGLEKGEKQMLAWIITFYILGIILSVLLNYTLASFTAAFLVVDPATAAANAEMYLYGIYFNISLIALICIVKVCTSEWWRRRKDAKKNRGKKDEK